MDYREPIAESFHAADRATLSAQHGDVTSIDSRRRRARPGTAQRDSDSRGAEEMLAMVCHELRGPLAAVRYAMKLWSSGGPEAPALLQLQATIERQTGRMTRLVDDLLDVSRVTNDRMQLHCELLDLRRIVGHAIATVASDIDTRGHELVESAPDGPVWVNGDAFRLEQVLVNLLANAAKYTEYGGRIGICTDVQGTQVMVRVRDSGIGIAPQLLPHIFDLFRQADEREPRSRSGLGIGLAIVRNLVELHGGNVAAESRGTGLGSEFTVSLPRAG